MEKIVDKHWFRTDEFEVVTEWPRGYIVWAIGRENFQHPGYLPLAQIAEEKYHIRTDTLKALYVGDEALCLAALDKAVKNGCDEAGFRRLQKKAKVA